MRYRKSNARRIFEGHIDYLKGVVSKAFSDLPGVADSDCRQFVLGHAIILGSAKFEDYIQDILTRFFNNLNANGVQTHNLPKELRAFLFNDNITAYAYRQFAVSNDEEKLLQSLIPMIGNDRLTFMRDGAPAPTIYASKIHSGVRYPSPKNILRLFRRLGIRNIFHEINRSSHTDLQSKLQSLNDTRTEIAHIGRLVGSNDRDVKRLLNEYKLIIEHIDRILFKYACQISSPSCWPS